MVVELVQFVLCHVRNALAFALLALEVDTHVRTVM